jgi:hypothetical protein
MPTLSMSLNCPPTGYTITWAAYAFGAVDAYVSINKNYGNVVYVSGDTNGSFSANSGDFIEIYSSSTTFTGLTAFSNIYVDSTLVDNDSGSPTSTSSYSFTVSGDHYISANAFDEL